MTSVLECESIGLRFFVLFKIVPGSTQSSDVHFWSVRLNPIIEIWVNFVTILFVVRVVVRSLIRGAATAAAIVFSFFACVIFSILSSVFFSILCSVVRVVFCFFTLIRSRFFLLFAAFYDGQLIAFLSIPFPDMNRATTHTMDNDREVG